jgi:hypothetical protein
MSILAGLAVLMFPASASAVRVIYAGDVAGDTSSTASFTFSAKGKFTKKGRFVPAKASGFDATLPFTCFDATGNVTSTSTRDDLPFDLAGPAGVTKKGHFFGAKIIQSPYASYTVSGTLRKGKASGILWAQQGVKNTGPACSTGTFADPNVTWTAKLIPPVCSAAASAVPLCSGAPRP